MFYRLYVKYVYWICGGLMFFTVLFRYLESFNVPGTVKRKCGSSSCTTSSTSDDDKKRDGAGATEGQ